MVGCHAALSALQKKTETNYDVKRSDNRELQAEHNQHHKQSREPRRTMDKQFIQDWTPSIMQDQWTAEEVEEHLTAAKTINEQQQQATREITSAHRTLKGVHLTLHYQILELTKNTENLKDRFFWICEQVQSSEVIKDEIKQQSRKQEQGVDSASIQKPGTKQSERSPSSRGLAGGQDQIGKALSARSSGQHDQGRSASRTGSHKIELTTSCGFRSVRKPANETSIEVHVQPVRSRP